MGISKHTEKRSRPAVVRSRLAGTAVRDERTPSDEREYVDIEVDPSGKMTTNPATLPRG